MPKKLRLSNFTKYFSMSDCNRIHMYIISQIDIVTML